MIRFLLLCLVLLAAPAYADVTAAQWKALLTKAAPGSTIHLGDQKVEFARQVFQPIKRVTIKGGRFRGVTLDQWKNVTFDGSSFEIADNDGTLAFLVIAYAPENLTFRDASFRGSEVNGVLQVKSLSIRGGRKVAVERSRFERLANFVHFLRTDGVIFRDNVLTDIREGVNLAGARNVLIEGNEFRGFRNPPGDHPDAVQFFTNGLALPTDTGARNVTIRQNLVIGRAQCVFMGDEAGLQKLGRGYDRITVTGNLCIGTYWNGIAANAGVTRLAIERNVLLHQAGPDKITTTWIKADTGRVIHNVAPKLVLGPLVEQAGNVAPGGTAETAISVWRAQRSPLLETHSRTRPSSGTGTMPVPGQAGVPCVNTATNELTLVTRGWPSR